jgi:hypothetical protein
MIRVALLYVASLVLLFPVQPPDRRAEGPAALVRKLHGEWSSGPCIGELTLRADGTFERQHYSPGDNTLTGTWEVRWDALPPTLILTCTASDYEGYIGREEVKLIRLDDEALVYQHPGGRTIPYERGRK